eukprot:m.793754 g.793754  ORF g.793754 m.793754 type:complete len:665 (+) comp23337_c0_seq1:164-2158(+)
MTAYPGNTPRFGGARLPLHDSTQFLSNSMSLPHLSAGISDPRKAKLLSWRQQKEIRKAAELKKRENMRPPFVVRTAPSVLNCSFGLRTFEGKQALRVPKSPVPNSNEGCDAASVDAFQLSTPKSDKENTIRSIEVDHEQDAASTISPRKDLASIFADEDKTCFLADRMAGLTVQSAKKISAVARVSPASPSKLDTWQTLATSSPLRALSGDDTTAVLPTTFNAITSESSTAVPTKTTLDLTDAAADDKTAAPAQRFRALACRQQTILEELVLHWGPLCATSEFDEGYCGDIRSAIGQANLLRTTRITQYLGLCDISEEPGEADVAAGQTVNGTDLEGFWDVIMVQIDDVKKAFATLQRSRDRGSVAQEEECRAPRKLRKRRQGISTDNEPTSRVKRGKKSSTVGKRTSTAKTAPAFARLKGVGAATVITPRRKAARARLAAIKHALRQGKPAPMGTTAAPAEEPQAAAVAVLTPVRATRKEREIHGTDFLLTPVRRSARKTPSRYRSDNPHDISKMLESTQYAYRPNAALNLEPTSPSPAGRGLSSDLDDPIPEEDDDDVPPPPPACSPPASPMTPSCRPSRTNKRGCDTPSEELAGSVKYFATVTISASARAHLGTDVVYTPVRRSRRLEGSCTSTPAHVLCSVADMPADSGYVPNPSLDTLF